MAEPTTLHEHPGVDPSACHAASGAKVGIDDVLAGWSEDPRLVHLQTLPGRPARLARTSRPINPAVADRLGPRPLWSHQAHAIDLLRRGTSVVLATPTASGKSLCYQIPALEACLERDATTLMVFPTKALARDQLRSLTEWDIPGVVASAYDGDCTPEERTWVRANADLLLTNPEMLHHGILPNHERWARFLHRLELVVVDELHVLRGVFGSHVAQVLRRLRRLVDHYGGSPRFAFTSATIGEPAHLASELCGLPVTAITADGSPSGLRTVALWNPGTAVSERVDGTGPSDVRAGSPEDRHRDDLPGEDVPAEDVVRRWSLNQETAEVAAQLVTAGLRTLVFCRSRRSTELVADAVRDRVARTEGSIRADPDGPVRSYRGGYLAEERRAIETELFDGRLRCAVATTALELGVDIGGLDAVVLGGYPGTVASFWQQIGRSGRERQPSLAVLVAGQHPLDQWLVRHPAHLFTGAAEPAVVSVDNPEVYVPHLACAAREKALNARDRGLWPDELDDGVRRLVLSDRATVRRRRSGPVAVWTGRGLPAPAVGLRSGAGQEIDIVEADGTLVGTVDRCRATAVVHPGAIYLHQGQQWEVVELDLDGGRAVVEATSGDRYTRARTATSFRILGASARTAVGDVSVGLGDVEVTTVVTGYQTVSVHTREVLDRSPLELPPTTLLTRATWYRFDSERVLRAGVSDRSLAGGLHAVEHAAIAILPLFAICDRRDVGGVTAGWCPDTGGPTVVIHDAHPGGSGIAEMAFATARQHLEMTLELVAGCDCTDGCPGCVQSPTCPSANEPLERSAAIGLLRTACDPSAGWEAATAS